MNINSFKQITEKGKRLLKIDKLDAKILKSLLSDGRIGFDELAKSCGASKNVVWKRYRSLKNKGIINGATVQMNFALFSYDALATLLISVDSQELEQIMEFIGKITEVRAYRQYNSMFNIRAVATLKNIDELDQVKQVIRRKLPITGLKTYIWTAVRNMPENLDLIGTSAGFAETKFKKPDHDPSSVIKIDNCDNQIVQKLTLDGRKSFSKIAKEIGLSTDTVVKRYHKLRNNGAIKVSIQINPNKIGYQSILDFNISSSSLDKVSQTVVDLLAKIPDVIIITKTSGDYDLQLTAMIRDVAQSFTIQDQIARVCGVTKIEVSARKIPDRWPTPQQYISTF